MTNKIYPKQLDVDVRITNKEEVTLCYTDDEAKIEANRCLNCINHPCTNGCPLHNNIPEFISKLKTGDYESAYDIISSTSPFPSICSRVCAQERQCEGNCTRGIVGEPVCIGSLERYVSEKHTKDKQIKFESNSFKVCIIGGGPSGLACGKTLAKLGYKVDIYEGFKSVGGELLYGIPEFRLPKKILNKEIDELTSMGINFILNSKITDKNQIEMLSKQYDALYIATGSSVPKFMKIPGESLKGVYSSKEFLRLFNLESDNIDFINNVKNKNVAVIGGGNSAFDTARCAIRAGAKSTTIIYRRSLEELPARKIELEEAQLEGVKLCLLTNPVEILESKDNKNHVGSIRCIRMELGQPDKSGRRRPVEIEGSEYEIYMDCVVMAISSSCESNVYDGLLDNKWGYILVNDNQKTNIDKIYAGGDVVTGPNTVIHAIKAGIYASKAIDELLNKN